MEFAVSGVSVSPLVPLLVAFVISFFTSMGGVSGAFLLLPFQMSVLGFTSPAVSSTNHLYNVVSIPSGVLRYIKEGRMLWPLTWAVVAGTLPGVVIGAWVRIRLLPDPQAFKIFAGFVLLGIGLKMVHELFSNRSGSKAPTKPDCAEATFEVGVQQVGLRRVSYTFQGREYSFSTAAVLTLSLVVGVIGGIYGIGGGAIIAPFFVAVLGLPVHTVAGAALMGTFVTSIVGVVVFQLAAPMAPELAIAPDWMLGLLFGLGGAVGMYCGARLQKHV
ncbi:MAG: sulfite exporter TauE/SafE family protein, partial [bacterium]|nr:sulfite exporter TauE/SafE family protein [bacterium]